jgi:hypothetical protein
MWSTIEKQSDKSKNRLGTEVKCNRGMSCTKYRTVIQYIKHKTVDVLRTSLLVYYLAIALVSSNCNAASRASFSCSSNNCKYYSRDVISHYAQAAHTRI